MKNNWFERLILAPLLTLPVIVLDPFTLYCWALGEDDAGGSPSVDADVADDCERR